MNIWDRAYLTMQLLIGVISLAFLSICGYVAYRTWSIPQIEFALTCSSTSSSDQMYIGYERGYLGFRREWNEYLVTRSGLARHGLLRRGSVSHCEGMLVNHSCDYVPDMTQVRTLNTATLILTYETKSLAIYSVEDDIIRETYQCENMPLEMFEQQRRFATLPVQLR